VETIETLVIGAGPAGLTTAYRLAKAGQVRVTVTDAAGDTMQVLNGPGAAGINRVAWAFAGKPAPRRVRRAPWASR